MINSENFDERFWSKVFDYIFFFVNSCQKITPLTRLARDIEEDCASMYIEKTEREHNVLIKEFEFFKHLQDYDSLILNNKPLKPFSEIWPLIKSYLEHECCAADFTIIHGDCCFSNILCGENNATGDVVLKFIDPRGTFGKSVLFGDIYYDLAKLSHSCSGGYEYFITDNFGLDVKGNEFRLKYSGGCKEAVNTMFQNYVEKYNFDQKKIKILEGTIFVGMCARHYDSLHRQKAMYITGLKILNEIYEEILL